MNRLSLSAVAGGLVVLASCSQEEIPKTQVSEGIPISFRAGVSTRVNPSLDYTSNPSTFYVTSFHNSHKASDHGGVMPDSHLTDEPFYLMGSNLYASSSNVKWPSQSEAARVEFFAYAPSLEEIQQAALTQLDPTASNYGQMKNDYLNAIKFFNLCQDGVALDPVGQHNTTFNGVTLYKGFKLGRFYVASDISKQVDFITAHVAADTPADEHDEVAKLGVKLNFKHQLSNIELRAFSGNKEYNIDIAGVRLGRPYTGAAIFNFCDAAGNVDYAEGGQWGIAKDPQRYPVQYIYGAGDEIYRMGVYNNMTGGQVIATPSHATVSAAASIMGKGGNAMVLPTKNGAWGGTSNRWIATKYGSQTGSEGDPFPDKDPWYNTQAGDGKWNADSADGDMYFSILIRVTMKPTANETTTTQIYPYGNNTNMNVVYIEKEKDSNKIVNNFVGYDKKPATISENNELVEFGWAAVPVAVDWQKGKKYVYTLDFSEGVGVQDPEDQRPGDPIIGDGIKFQVSISDWDEINNPTTVPKE